jgi:hypothetical protein
MSTTTTTHHRCAGTIKQEAASPPLTPPMCRAWYGAAPSRLQGADASLRDRAFGRALDPVASTTPWGSQTRAGTGPAPADARHPSKI